MGYLFEIECKKCRSVMKMDIQIIFIFIVNFHKYKSINIKKKHYNGYVRVFVSYWPRVSGLLSVKGIQLISSYLQILQMVKSDQFSFQQCTVLELYPKAETYSLPLQKFHLPAKHCSPDWLCFSLARLETSACVYLPNGILTLTGKLANAYF